MIADYATSGFFCKKKIYRLLQMILIENILKITLNSGNFVFKQQQWKLKLEFRKK